MLGTSASGSRAHRAPGDQGFTLIELLVVVLIVGILSAIAIPIFTGQQIQAQNAAAKSDLGAAKVAMVSYATATGSYTSVVANLTSYGYKASPGTSATSIRLGAGNRKFCIQTKAVTGTTWKLTDRGSVITGACTAADVA